MAPDTWGTGYCFLSISLFIPFFVSLSAKLRENGWTDLHEIFREGVEWPWDDLITFLVNPEKPRDAAMRNTDTGLVVLSLHCLFIVYCHKPKLNSDDVQIILANTRMKETVVQSNIKLS